METAIRGEVAGGWSGTIDIDARVMDELTDEWTEDLDLSLEPAPERVAHPQPQPAPRRRWGLALLAMVGLLGVLALGTAFVVVIAAAAIVGALMLIPVATFPEAPALEQPTIEMVTPVIVDVPATVVPDEEPPARKPAPAKPSKRAPAATPDKSDAKLVVMPDPAFRAKPADEAIERLKKKVDRGEAGTVVGK